VVGNKVNEVYIGASDAWRIGMSKLCVIVPTYNEAKNLSTLVTRVEKVLCALDFSFVIVDDNSSDKTAEVAKKLNQVYGNVIVRCREREVGLGSAIVEGLKTCLAMDGVDRILTLDGDLSHNPTDIPRLLQAAQEADLVQGSRYIENGSIRGWGLTRRLTSYVANLICRFLFGTSVHDYTGNFRVYSRECAEAIVNCTNCKGFDWTVEAMFVAKKYGFRVKEVPISFRDREDGKTKLCAKEIANWVSSAMKSFLSPAQPCLKVSHHPTLAIQRSSTFNVTVTPPMVSTTIYTLSSRSPSLSDHAESNCLVKSKE